ncbi:hypothetical protein TRIUR3_30876 [Triticum urartu]|uniref:Uncharacterized protein n=1 Tax=Triticum urartu TaxID=4572 RepID=M7ZUH5_TRIUA|nr:hypothetical protein TRIUR3_30876 [Triticum urartu]
MEDRDHGPAENLPKSPHRIVDGDEEGDEDGGGFTFPVLPFAADALIVPVYPISGRPPPPPPAASVDEQETATGLPSRGTWRKEAAGATAAAPPMPTDGVITAKEEEEEEAAALAGGDLTSHTSKSLSGCSPTLLKEDPREAHITKDLMRPSHGADP